MCFVTVLCWPVKPWLQIIAYCITSTSPPPPTPPLLSYTYLDHIRTTLKFALLLLHWCNVVATGTPFNLHAPLLIKGDLSALVLGLPCDALARPLADNSKSILAIHIYLCLLTIRGLVKEVCLTIDCVCFVLFCLHYSMIRLLSSSGHSVKGRFVELAQRIWRYNFGVFSHRMGGSILLYTTSITTRMIADTCHCTDVVGQSCLL